MNKFVLLIFSILLTAFTGCSSGGEDIPSQEQEKDVLTISIKEYSVKPEGEDMVVSFNTNKDWTVTSNVAWCVLSVSNGQKGAQSLNIKVLANEEMKDRTAVVTIKAGTATGTVTIVQKAPETMLELAQKDFNVTHKGDNLKISFKTDASWTVSSDQDWCVLSDTEGDEGENEITVTVNCNETDEDRIAKVTIKAGSATSTITIVQGKNLYINTDSETYKVSFIGGIIEVEVKHNVEYEILIDASWITKTDSEQGEEKEILMFEAESNQGADERKATITFYNQDLDLKTSIVVTQGGMPEDNSIQPNGSLGNMTWG